MYEIKSVTCGVIGTNTYMIRVGDKAILIDPAEYTAVKNMLDSESVTVTAILLTHGHFDHILAVAQLKSEYNCNVYCHVADFNKCKGVEMANRIKEFGVTTFTPDINIADIKNIELLGLNIIIMHTPGHSAGSVCYILDSTIFTGDTIFRGSYGRYDFYDGDLAILRKSIAEIFALEGDYRILPGHDEPSQLSYERRNNMILWS